MTDAYHIHHYHHFDMRLDEATWRIIQEINRKIDLVLHKEDMIMSAETDALDQAEAAAKANSDADDSAEKLLLTLVQMITDLKNNVTDPAVVARITALATALSGRASQLATAVVAGTPADPVPRPKPDL